MVDTGNFSPMLSTRSYMAPSHFMYANDIILARGTSANVILL